MKYWNTCVAFNQKWCQLAPNLGYVRLQKHWRAARGIYSKCATIKSSRDANTKHLVAWRANDFTHRNRKACSAANTAATQADVLLIYKFKFIMFKMADCTCSTQKTRQEVLLFPNRLYKLLVCASNTHILNRKVFLKDKTKRLNIINDLNGLCCTC